jgi:lysozyme
VPTASVIDLSHHNNIPSSLQPAFNAGIAGCIHKLTEGHRFVDSKVEGRFFLAKEAGMKWGVYHFVRPGDMKQQAEFFFDTGEKRGVIDRGTLLALDWEVNTVSAGDAIAFMEHLEYISLRSPVLYSGNVCKEDPDERLGKWRLWLAHYARRCVLPSFAETYYLWQYTDEGKVAGIIPPTDLNHYDGPIEELMLSWSGGSAVTDSPVPIPVPAPESRIVTLDVAAPAGIEVRITINGQALWTSKG